jgi:hypothetical protein
MSATQGKTVSADTAGMESERPSSVHCAMVYLRVKLS